MLLFQNNWFQTKIIQIQFLSSHDVFEMYKYAIGYISAQEIRKTTSIRNACDQESHCALPVIITACKGISMGTLGYNRWGILLKVVDVNAGDMT